VSLLDLESQNALALSMTCNGMYDVMLHFQSKPPSLPSSCNLHNKKSCPFPLPNEYTNKLLDLELECLGLIYGL
jgi:hypothetical protein